MVAEAQPEVVFHLAAQASVPVSMRDPATDVLTNVLGGVHVAQAAAEAGTRRIVFFSTGGALHGAPRVLPANEDTPIAPDAVYGASKIAAEHELGALCRHLGLELSVLRPGNIYGPGQDAAGESGVVAIFTSRMLAGEAVTIFGDGSQQRDYVYVDDVVEAALLAAEREPATCVIGTGEGTSTQRIFDTLARDHRLLAAPRVRRGAPRRPRGDLPRRLASQRGLGLDAAHQPRGGDGAHGGVVPGAAGAGRVLATRTSRRRRACRCAGSPSCAWSALRPAGLLKTYVSQRPVSVVLLSTSP